MIDTKLIFIEGLAGSGKSTTGQKLFKTIFDDGYRVQFFHEFTSPHPVIDPAIGECRNWVDKIISDYTNFAADLRQSDEIIILDGALYQNAVAECLERNIEKSEIITLVLRIYDIIKVSNPVLIYLYQNDFESALRKTFNKRFESWQQKVTSYFSRVEYGRHKKQEGLDLYIQFNRDLKNISDILFEKFTMRKIAVENSDGRWHEYNEKIFGFLGLIYANDSLKFDDYTGLYKESDGAINLEIVAKNGIMEIHGLFPKSIRLHQRHEDVFFVEGKVQEIEFIRGENGEINKLQTKNFVDNRKNKDWKKCQHINEGKL